MNVSWIGFLARNHSWSFVAQNFAKQFINKNYNIDLFSTNGVTHFSEELQPYLKGSDDSEGKMPFEKVNKHMKERYDISMSYTAPRNFGSYLSKGERKFAIWAMEFFGKNTFPKGFAKNYVSCDKILPPSKFCYNVFIDQGVPHSRLQIIPHGYDDAFVSRKKSTILNTDRNFKFLLNCGQLHKRKNIEGVLETFCKAFNSKDDVVLIVKARGKQIKSPFEVSLDDIYNRICSKYPNRAPIVIVPQFLDDISDLYRACNCVVSLSHGEGFNLPILEAIASNKIPLCLSKGGQEDFIKDAAVAVECTEVRAPIDYQYWEPSIYAKMYKPDANDAVDKMRYIYSNEAALLNSFQPTFERIRKEYSWKSVFEMFEQKCLT